jgi:hypothetical protein
MKSRVERRSISAGSLARSEIVAVGRADLRHVIIVFAPCNTAAAACDVSRLPSAFRVLWFLFGAVRKNFAADTQTPRYQAVPHIESLDPGERHASRGQSPPFLIQDEPRVRELWLKLPATPVCRDDT